MCVYSPPPSSVDKVHAHRNVKSWIRPLDYIACPKSVYSHIVLLLRTFFFFFEHVWKCIRVESKVSFLWVTIAIIYNELLA